MPHCQPIRPLFVTPKTASSNQQTAPTLPKKRNSDRRAPRAHSVSPIDTSFKASFSTADKDQHESGSSSSDVSPIEDLHRPLQSQFQVQGEPPFSTTTTENAESSRPSNVPLARARNRQADSPDDGLFTTTSRSLDDISQKYPYSKTNNINSKTRDDVNYTGSPPKLMRDPGQRAAHLANQREGQGCGPNHVGADAGTQSAQRSDANRSQGMAPLLSISKHIIQIGSDRQIPTTHLSKQTLETKIQDDQSQTQLRRGLNEPMQSKEGAKSPRTGYPDITRPAVLASNARKGVIQPRYSSDRENKNHASRKWPKFEMGASRSGKSPTAPAQDHQWQTQWNRSHFGDQPSSRFSDTSCSTITYDSPPSTPEKNFERRVGTPSLSVVSRKKLAEAPSMQSLNTIRRKPTPSEAHRSLSLNNEAQGNEKPLPKSPPEAQAVTRVASLEAKLEALRQRRTNLQTIVDELTNVTQRSPIAYDLASRQKMKKTIDGLRNEISGVGKEEHETGLQLHRAWKREEETSTFESSPLWVKRLAS